MKRIKLIIRNQLNIELEWLKVKNKQQQYFQKVQLLKFEQKMGSKKQKKQQQPDDIFMKMTAPELESNLKLLKEKVSEVKSKRNYIQMDRDMVEQFYHNTEQQINEMHAEMLNKEAEAETMQMTHNSQVKVFLQKLKLLEYEQEKANINVQDDGEKAKDKQNTYYETRMRQMKRTKQDLKRQLVEDEKMYVQKTQLLQKDHRKKQQYMMEENEGHLSQLERKYIAKLQKMKQQLQLKLRVQIHELEERKNLHINELMKNHQEAFNQLKNYYNQITRDNLKLIKDHKTQIKKINQESQKNKKKILQLRSTNNDMKEPLKKLGLERDKLKSLLRQFEKHKMSRQNYRSKLIAIRERVFHLETQFAELSAKYETVMTERKELESKFDKLTQQVKKHAQMYNVVLMRRMESELEQLEQKQAQLQQLVQNAVIEPGAIEDVKGRVKESIEQKNQVIKSLKYSIHHATKAYNDAIRVYEAKLVQFEIPSEELGFQPLPTLTSTMPAGLVSS